MPVICGVVNPTGVVELDACAVCETAMTVGVFVIPTRFEPEGELVGVPGSAVLEGKLALMMLLGTLVSDGVVAATTTLGSVLGDEVCVSITNVAVIVAWVFGKALAFPTHMLYAFLATSAVALAPWQKFALSSDIIHCTAPSPTV
jgi:hypothetical protein